MEKLTGRETQTCYGLINTPANTNDVKPEMPYIVVGRVFICTKVQVNFKKIKCFRN